MGCSEYAVLISKYLDGALNEDEYLELKQHLAVCVDCRVAVGRFRRLDSYLHTLGSVPAPTQVRRDVFQRAETGHIWQTRGFWQRWSVRIVSGLLVAVLVIAGMALPVALSNWLSSGTGPVMLFGLDPIKVTSRCQAAIHGRQVLVTLDTSADDTRHLGLPLRQFESSNGAYRIYGVPEESEMVQAPVRVINMTRVDRLAPQDVSTLSQLADWPEFIPGGKWRVVKVITSDGLETIRVVREGR